MPQFIPQIALFVGSLIIQDIQSSKIKAAQRKAQEEAAARADAAKGFQLVTTGEPTAIPVIYGRAKVGGSRVYHRTVSDYTVPAGLESTLSGMGATVLRANNPVVLDTVVAPKRRVYFVGPPGLSVKPIANTEFSSSMPVVEGIDGIMYGVAVGRTGDLGGYGSDGDASGGADGAGDSGNGGNNGM